MIERESTVLFFRDLHKTLRTLSDEDAGILMKALFAHANKTEPEGLEKSPIAAALYIGISDQIDRLEEYRAKKAISGKIGGSKPKQNEANGSKTKQTEANGKQNRSKPEQSEPPYPSPSPYPSPLYPSSHEEGGKRFAPPTLEEVRDYVREAGLQMDPQRFFDYFTSNGWKVSGRAPMKDWKAAARNWAAREKVYRPENKKDERRIDYDAAIRDLYIREVSGG